MTPRSTPSLFASLAALVAVSATAPASAQGVPQPAPFYVNGTQFTSVPVNQALSGDYFDANRYNVATLGLGSLFAGLAEQVDYQADAATQPAVFSPLCGLSGQMILRGGSCRMDFGWYCVDDPTTFVPLVTAAEVLAYHDSTTAMAAWSLYNNGDKGFVPLVGMPPVQGSPLDGVQTHPVFANCLSKQIGFTIKPVVGAAGIIPSVNQAVCTQQKFSEASLNTIHAATGQPWVSAVTYASKRTPGVYYIAFEDLPSDANTFNPPLTVTSGTWVADGDFNDFVYRVEGIQCKGGGQRCNTTLLGICSIGITECTIDDTAGACTQKFQPSAELCDNIDNDCNGVVDDGVGMCPDATPICYAGQCVARCSTGEFTCNPGSTCDAVSNACIDDACYGITCGENQSCRSGVCIGGCEGVVCPAGQDCLFGNCVDLCQGIGCPAGFVCQAGSCIADCHCIGCLEGFTCGDDGKCIDSLCIGVVCPNAGDICQAGACVNLCANANCPPGQVCDATSGACVTDPLNGTGGEGIEGTGGGIVVGTGSTPGVGVGGTGAGNSAPLAAPEGTTSCGCRTVGGQTPAGAVALLLLGLGLTARRRRQA